METKELTTWNEFRAAVDQRTVSRVIWRGQRDARWPLSSPYDRHVGKMERAGRIGHHFYTAGGYEGFRRRFLEDFKRAASGLRGPNPAELTEEQWWALGRHYGLVTPLLDWSDSPYIAAFFAIAELAVEMGSLFTGIGADTAVAVFRLEDSPRLGTTTLRILRPVVHELGRMHGQRGLFTWLDHDAHRGVEEHLDHAGAGDLLTKLVLRGPAISEAWRDLRLHGIDYRLLFPDLLGAAMHANSVNW